MNRKCLEILCVLLAALVLVACGGKELPEGFDKESVIKNADSFQHE